MKKGIIILLTMLLLPVVRVTDALRAAPYYFKHYQVQDGLSNNIINCFLQDRSGFMWIGTRDGLNRFDGYSFHVFRENPEEANSLGSSYITSLATDGCDRLWVATVAGVYSYNEYEESFNPVSFSRGMRTTDLVFDAEGDLWMLAGRRLVSYNVQLDAHHTYAVPDNASITSFCISPTGAIWVVLSNGMLYRLNKTTGEFFGHDLFAHTSDYTMKNLTRVVSSHTGDKLFIGTTTEGAKIFDVYTEVCKDILQDELKKGESCVQGFLQRTTDELWIASENGLYIYSIRSNSYTHVVKRPYDPYSLSSDLLYHFFQDNENGIWIGTYAGGINYYSPFQPFEKYYAYPGQSVMQGNLVHDICTDRYDNLWIATEDAGVNKLDVKTGRYTNYQLQGERKSVMRTNIHGLVPDGDNLWVGSLNGIIRIDIPSDRTVKQYTLEDNSGIVLMKKILSGALLVGTTNGMYRYNEEKDLFEYMPDFQSNVHMQSILEDHTGVIWAGTAGQGLYYYNPHTEKGGKLSVGSGNSFSNNVVNDIIEDKNNELWFATFAGVKKYNPEGGRITVYNINRGMPSNTTFRILEDKSGNKWISTANGLACLNPETEEIKVYMQDHGLITNQFNYNSGWKDKSGRMYFGMVRGMISFVPEEIRQVNHKVKVYLTRMRVYNKAIGINIPTYPITYSDRIELAHDASTFSLDFSSLSYIAPGITQYAFLMEGFEDNWTYLTNTHTAYYTKLAPGHYTFKVKGSNVSGLWNDEPTVLRITVHPPWWLSHTAVCLYAVMAMGLCVLIVYRFMRQNRRKMERRIEKIEDDKEKEVYQAKINFFINVAHEIRTPLTLIKSPLEKVMMHDKTPDEAQHYLNIMDKNVNRLLSLVNQLLDFRNTELDGYRLSFVKTDIVGVLKEICFRFKDTIEQKKLSFTLQLNMDSLDVYIDQEALTKIISNLLTNAVKYASSLIRLTLNYVKENDFFTLDVVNDGQPIPSGIKDKIFEPFFRGKYAEHIPGTGLGLPLARSLAERHRGTLRLVDTNSSLILFRLCLPINQPDSVIQPDAGEDKTAQYPTVSLHPDKHKMNPSLPAILLVEDNEEMKDFIGSEAVELYNVFTASNGEEALLFLNEYSIQLVVSDVMMPVMDGFTLLKRIKTDLEFSHIPVILLTAQNTMQARLEGLELGADAYIDKPFSMDILLAQITNLLNNRNSIRQYYFKSPIAHMKSIAYTKADEHFLERLNGIIEEHIDNIKLDVEMIADRMNLSRPTLYRKISALSNLTPNELIRLTRLKNAAELILKGEMKIYEISEAVGFNSQSYFSRAFSRQFGMSPTEYAMNNRDKSSGG
ncbi:MAG: response regulator [Tannerellaceae bacterium]|jgi:ligand-binding sensor domain-containing protein/signal transduction histidine kinase/DNA-binding response OmpR family regulator|nr:response regulator [Tannerellaceae bacterium]